MEDDAWIRAFMLLPAMLVQKGGIPIQCCFWPVSKHFKELSSSNEHICSFVVSVCVVMEQIWPEAIVESFEMWKKEAGSQGTSDGESFFRSIIDSCSLLLSSEGALLIPS